MENADNVLYSAAAVQESGFLRLLDREVPE